MKRLIYTLVFLIGLVGQATGQNYIQLEDASGATSQPSVSALGDSVDVFIASLQAEFKDSIKVIDFGFYLHHPVLNDGIPDAIVQKRLEADELSPYYILIGKETNPNGLHQKIWVSLKMPGRGPFQCISDDTEDFHSILESELNASFQKNYDNSSTDLVKEYTVALGKMMSGFSARMTDLQDCCFTTNLTGEVCTTCYTDPVVTLGRLIDANAIIDILDVYDPPTFPTVLKGTESKSGDASDAEFIFSSTPDKTYTLQELCEQVDGDIRSDYLNRFDQSIYVKSFVFVFEEDCDNFQTKLDEFNSSEAAVSVFYALFRQGGEAVFASIVKTDNKLLKTLIPEQAAFRAKNISVLTPSLEHTELAALILNRLRFDELDLLELDGLGVLKELVEDLELESREGTAGKLKTLIKETKSAIEENYSFHLDEADGYKALKSRIAAYACSLNGALYYDDEKIDRKNVDMEFLHLMVNSLLCANNKSESTYDFYWPGTTRDGIINHIFNGRSFADELKLGNLGIRSVVSKGYDASAGYKRMKVASPLRDLVKVKLVNNYQDQKEKRIRPLDIDKWYQSITFIDTDGAFSFSFLFNSRTARKDAFEKINLIFQDKNNFSDKYFEDKAIKIAEEYDVRNQVSENVISLLYSSSPCTYENLGSVLRKKFIEHFLDEISDDKEEVVVSNLFGSISLKNNRYKEFIEQKFNPSQLEELGTSVDSRPGRLAFVRRVTALHNKYLESLIQSELRNDEERVKGFVNFDNPQEIDYENFDGGEYSIEYINQVKDFYKLSFEPFRSDVVDGEGDFPDVMITKLDPVKVGEFAPYDEVRIRSEKHFSTDFTIGGQSIEVHSGEVPFLVVAFILDNINDDNNFDQAMLAIDVVFFAIGVTEFSAALKAYRASTLSSKLAQSARLTAASLDIFVGGLSVVVCSDPSSELCRNYRKNVEPWLLGGALAGSSLEAFARRGLRRTDLLLTARKRNLSNVDDLLRNAKNLGKTELTILEELTEANLKKLNDDLVEIGGLSDYLLFDFSRLKSWQPLSNVARSVRTVDNINAINLYETINPGSLSRIKELVEGIKRTRRNAFCRGLGNVSNNRSLLLQNSRLASVDEVAEAVNSLRTFRGDNPLNITDLPERNVAEVKGVINADNVENLTPNKTWVSGEKTPIPSDSPPIWNATNAPDSNGTSYLRNFDSEYKMLNTLARRLQPDAVVGGKYLTHTGELKIISEIPYCESCSGIIQEFNDMFPNIKVILIDGIK